MERELLYLLGAKEVAKVGFLYIVHLDLSLKKAFTLIPSFMESFFNDIFFISRFSSLWFYLQLELQEQVQSGLIPLRLPD